MQTMYVLQAQGLGDDENAYESIGVYNSKQNKRKKTLCKHL